MVVAVRREQRHPAVVALVAYGPRRVLEVVPRTGDGQPVPLEEVGAVVQHHRLHVERDAEHPLLERGQPQCLRQEFRPQPVADQVRDVAADPVDGEARDLRVFEGGDVRGVVGPRRVAELGVTALCAPGDLLEIDLDGVVAPVERVHDLLAAPEG